MLRRIVALLLIVVTWSTSQAVPHWIPIVPNPHLTTGSVCTPQHRDFREFRYRERIPYCRRNVSPAQRRVIYEAYGIPEACRHRYIVDHFFPLSMGGDNSNWNLWPEHALVQATRPNLEFEVYLALDRGELSQRQALEIIYYYKTHLRLDLRDIRGCG